ncbi:MAG: MarR family transcriptional regulator [Candidatus Elarobacter sp.]
MTRIAGRPAGTAHSQFGDAAVDENSTFWSAVLVRVGREFPGASVTAIQAVLAVLACAQRVESAASAWLAPTGLTPPRFNAMMAIWLAEPSAISLSEVGRRMFTTRSNVTGVVDGLERAQLVTRAAHPTDRRSILLALTDVGRAKLRSILPMHFAHVDGAVSGLSSTEQRELVRLLNRLCASIPNPSAVRAQGNSS